MRQRKAFTLIELLVVIAIIALLMAILMPALQRVKKQVKTVVCQTQLKQWGVIFSMYTDGNNGYFSAGYWSPTMGHGDWIKATMPYYKEAKLRCCPMATKLEAEGGRIPFAAWQSNYYVEGAYGSYGINAWVYNLPPDVQFSHGSRPAKNHWRIPNVKGVGYIPLFLDCWWYGSHPEPTNQPPEYDGERTGGMKRFCLNRHDGAVNAVFVDWSVRKLGLKELWKLKWHRSYDINYLAPVWPQWMRRFKDY